MTTITTRVVRDLRKRGVTVLTHKDWGSGQRQLYAARRRNTAAGRWGNFTEVADTVVQHITVTPPPPAERGAFAAACRLVERIGVDRFGSGVSYNWLVDMRSGAVAVGQPLDSKGAHTLNDKSVAGYSYDQNLRARAIAVVGMPNTVLSDKAAGSIVELLAAMVAQGAITPGFDYVPHSMFAAKDCPCDSTRDRMPLIRRAVAAHVKAVG